MYANKQKTMQTKHFKPKKPPSPAGGKIQTPEPWVDMERDYQAPCSPWTLPAVVFAFSHRIYFKVSECGLCTTGWGSMEKLKNIDNQWEFDTISLCLFYNYGGKNEYYTFNRS